MANLYVRSTDGSDSDNGSTWALANATLAGAAAIDAAGDTIYVSQAHSESTASAVTLALAGTLASPTAVICASDAAEPPTAVATTASVATTGASNITISGSAYLYGLQFSLGNATSAASLQLGQSAGAMQCLDSCAVRLTGSGSTARIQFGTPGVAPGLVRLTNTTVRFASVAQGFAGKGANFEWSGGSVESGGTALTTAIFRNGNDSNRMVTTWKISGVDLANLGTSCAIWEAGTNGTVGVLRNSKLPAAWSGALITGTLLAGDRVELHNCDSGDTNYRLWVEDYCGSIKTETTIVRTGGASDGTTAYSWKLASSANAEYPLLPLVTPELPAEWNATVGSSVTATVEIVTDGVTLTDGECWLEVQYLGTSGYPLSSFASDAKADVLATAANQTTSTESWTTTGLASPTKQKLSVTVTPQDAGFIQAVVKLAKASTTVYVDPKITLT